MKGTRLIICLLFISLFGYPIYTYDLYRVNSNSMASTLLEGDIVLVMKNRSLNKKRKNHGKKDNVVGEIVVFKHPRLKEFMIKRCIAGPSDILSFCNNGVFINDSLNIDAPTTRYKFAVGSQKENLLYRFADSCGIEIVPGADGWHNVCTTSDMINYLESKNLINNCLRIRRVHSYIGKHFEDSVKLIFHDSIDRFTFLQESILNDCFQLDVNLNSYFLMGDNRYYSYDSRNWGEVNIEDLKGIAILILFSKCPQKKGLKGYRSDRFFKILK